MDKKRNSRRERPHRKLAVAMAIAGVILVSADGNAGGEQAKKTPDDGMTELERIVVTAEKRPSFANDLPVAITAFDSDALETFEFSTLADLPAQVPNLQVQTLFANVNPTIFIRGIGLDQATANANGSVGIYRDEVYVNSPAAQLFQMFDLERVEVLRGPQGTLYGRNTTGGAINFIARKPTNEYNARAAASYGRYDQVDLEGAIGLPIVEDLAAARLAFVLNDRDGITKNVVTGNHVNDRYNWAARGLFRLTPNSESDWLLNIHGGQNRAGARQYENQPLLEPGPDGLPLIVGGAPVRCADPPNGCVDRGGYVESDDPFQGAYNKEGDEDIDSFGASLTGSWDFPDSKLTSISAYEWNERRTDDDTDASPNEILEAVRSNSAWQVSQELRLASIRDTPIEWLGGAYLFIEDLEVDNQFDVFFGDVRQRYNQDTSSFAFFGQASYDILEKVTLTGGIRYTWERKRFDIRSNVPAFLGPGIDETEEETWNALSGRTAISYRPTDNLLLFASYDRGFKSGGFNGGALENPIQADPIDPEFVNTFQVGAKTSWFNNRLWLDIIGFYNDWNDLQVFRLEGFTVILDNAAKAKTYGLEIESQMVPFPGLSTRLGLGLLQSEYEDFVLNEAVLDPEGNVLSPERDISGNTLVSAPKVSFNGDIEYELPISDYGYLRPRLDFSYTSEQFFDEENLERHKQEGYWLLNARLAFQTMDGSLELAGWVRNLTDERYLIEAADASDFGFDLLAFGDPRTYGLTVTYRYF